MAQAAQPTQYRWFRVYSEAAADPKLNFLTSDQFRVWFKLLCVASEQEDRGIIKEERFLLSLKVSNGDKELLNETLELLEKLKIIELREDAIEFINFMKRQYDSESKMPAKILERVNKHREKKKLKSECNKSITNCNESVTSVKQDETGCNAYSNSNNTIQDSNNTIQDSNNTIQDSLQTTTFQSFSETFSESPNENETQEENYISQIADYYTHLTGRPMNHNDYVSVTGVLNSDLLPDFPVKVKIIKQCMSELCSKNGTKIHAFAYFSPKILDEFKSYGFKTRPKQKNGGEPNGGFRPVPEDFANDPYLRD